MDRHLVDVVGQIPDRSRDTGHALVGGRRGGTPLQIRAGDAAPQLPQRGPPLRVGHHHEVPVLGVAGRRCLLAQPQALLEHLPLDRAGQIEALADAAGRGQQLIGGEVQQHAR
jgi:hypothetical protein